jgi:hypothetical protein
MAATPHEGDIGSVFRITLSKADGTAFSLVGATTLEVLMEAPSGAIKIFPGILSTDGSDGTLQYTTVAASDLNEVGGWKIQAHVIVPAGNFHSDVAKFKVGANL